MFKGTKIKGPIAAELRFQEIIEIVQTARAMI
jgi:ribosomal protein L14